MKAINKYTLRKEPTTIKGERVVSSEISERILREIYANDGSEIEVCEYFYVLFLNNNNEIAGYAKLSQGGIDGVNVDVRLLTKYAIDTLSTSVVLAHNHPSGSTIVSRQDKDMTRNIIEALNIFSVRVLDHLIITAQHYVSMLDEGLI